eukprot:7564935-Ditylum_brightwellii.AAC.1
MEQFTILQDNYIQLTYLVSKLLLNGLGHNRGIRGSGGCSVLMPQANTVSFHGTNMGDVGHMARFNPMNGSIANKEFKF